MKACWPLTARMRNHDMSACGGEHAAGSSQAPAPVEGRTEWGGARTDRMFSHQRRPCDHAAEPAEPIAFPMRADMRML